MLHALATRADGATGEAWPSVATLARDTRIDSLPTVRLALRALERLGYVKRFEPSAGRLTATYVLQIGRIGLAPVDPNGNGNRSSSALPALPDELVALPGALELEHVAAALRDTHRALVFARYQRYSSAIPLTAEVIAWALRLGATAARAGTATRKTEAVLEGVQVAMRAWLRMDGWNAQDRGLADNAHPGKFLDRWLETLEGQVQAHYARRDRRASTTTTTTLDENRHFAAAAARAAGGGRR